MKHHRHLLLLAMLTSTLLLSGCFSAPTERVVDSFDTLRTLSGSVQEYQQRLDDLLEYGKLKGTEIKEGAEEAKERVGGVVEGIEKVQEGIDLIKGEGDDESSSSEGAE